MSKPISARSQPSEHLQLVEYGWEMYSDLCIALLGSHDTDAAIATIRHVNRRHHHYYVQRVQQFPS
jgi:hypothetical protein